MENQRKAGNVICCFPHLAMNVYPGDKSFCESSQVHKGRRNSDEDRDQDRIDPSPEGVTFDHYKAALKHG